MKSTSVFALTALAATWAIFDAKAPGKLASQSEGESFSAGGPRSFEIVPLETVSETSANASIGDLNGDGYLDIVLEGSSLAGAKPDFLWRRQGKLPVGAESAKQSHQDLFGFFG